MDKRLEQISSAEELINYLLEHNGTAESYDDETHKRIMELVTKFGLSKNVLKIHYRKS